MSVEYHGNCMVVKSTGMCSSLGNSAQSFAAFRGSMSREKELLNMPYYDRDEFQQHFITAHSAMDSSEGFQGLARLIILGATALADLEKNAGETRFDNPKTGLFLCFPEYFEYDPALEVVGYEVEEFVRRLVAESQVMLNLNNMEVFYDGTAGVAMALEQAHRALLEGKYKQCIVGSIDSLLLQGRINQLIIDEKIKTADNTYGLIPGEASCFILLDLLANTRRNEEEADLTIVAYSRQIAEEVNEENDEQTNPVEQPEEQENAQPPDQQPESDNPLEKEIVLHSKLITNA
ncbi:hypothetical protein, partial [Kaarinaea lacus]